MRNILIIGAGKSSSSLINYLLEHSSTEQWILTVADHSEETARAKIAGHPSGKAVKFDLQNENDLQRLVSEATLVISMLPANMHFPVAQECLRQKKNLITASYVSREMQELHKDVSAAGLLFLNECGLDPGIDHMSAMQIIDNIKQQGGSITLFRSYTGGLVAPESNDNPWGYKFSWNPRNVILAGQGTARYIENGKYKYIPYNRLFLETRPIAIDGYGSFDGYANRDSLSYRKHYGLEKIQTMIRGTLRQSGFCRAWNVFVKLGLTDDSYVIEDSKNHTYESLVEALLPSQTRGNNTEERLSNFSELPFDSREMQLIRSTGIVDKLQIGLSNATPAQVLQKLLEEKWKLKESDKDMIVMQHQFEYRLNNKEYSLVSSLVVKGDNSINTAMAKTVGLPIAIAARLLMNGKIAMKGIQIPVHREIYVTVLDELKNLGIRFAEKQNVIV